MPITANPAGCWILHDEDGKPVGSTWPSQTDDPVHFDTEDAARADAEREEYDGRTLTPVQLTDVCYIATSVCGTVYDEDDEGIIVHFESAEKAVADMTESSYTILPDGQMACPDTWDCGCTE